MAAVEQTQSAQGEESKQAVASSNGTAESSSSSAPNQPKNTPKLLHLVVDSGAIIKGTNLTPLAENFWTVPDVLDEIRDKHARNLLQRLPFTLQTREPSSEAMNAVVNFSRKTGDFAYLSLTDLRVMALTFMLEAEINGTDHLRTSPEASVTVTRNAGSKPVCKYFGTALGCKYGKECHFSHERSTNDAQDVKVSIPCRYFNTPNGCKYGEKCPFLHEPKENTEEDQEEAAKQTPTEDATPAADVDSRAEETKPDISEDGVEVIKTKPTQESTSEETSAQEEKQKEEGKSEQVADAVDEEKKPAGGAPSQEIRPEVKAADVKSRILGGMGAQSNAGALEDDGKNWINEENLSKFMSSPFGDTQGEESISAKDKVGCVTTDFSMQNVMLQMGLKLVSADGMVIRRVKKWILKCIACFTTTTEMERLFCPKCGNSTLERVSYSIDQNGQMVFYTRANRPVKLTGTKFSLPMPKGGRQGDLLLREDQLMVGIWGQRQRQHKKVLKSAFGENVAHDLGVQVEKQNQVVVGYGRMNPNAQKGRERRGKKKKNH